MKALDRGTQITLLIATVATVLAGILSYSGASAVLTFVVAGASLATLATLVGSATEQIGARLGPGATGVLQSALGNLPELFVGIFALRDGQVAVVQSALVGSILGNSLLVLGLAFFVGGLRHGTQRFASGPPRMIAVLTLLCVAALAVPTLATGLHAAAGKHETTLSVICAVVLLIIFVASIPFSLSDGAGAVTSSEEELSTMQWPVWLAAAILTAAAVGAAFVSDWFVGALNPAMQALHLSSYFTGLVIVALAGNAVENVIGVQLAARNKPEYAISVIMNSSLQVAIGLIPVLVLLSFVIGGTTLTLVLPPLLLAGLALAAIVGALVVYDGESTWLEGLVLMGLYAIIAVSFWWG